MATADYEAEPAQEVPVGGRSSQQAHVMSTIMSRPMVKNVSIVAGTHQGLCRVVMGTGACTPLTVVPAVVCLRRRLGGNPSRGLFSASA